MEKVTIVIPTYNRSGKLLETLDALAVQDTVDFHVIISDDGSSDGTQKAVEEKKAKLPFTLDYFFHPNGGASESTNLGVGRAEDGLIILLDDDILPARETISKHIRFHRTHPGSILSGSADTDPERSVTDVQRYKLYMETEWKKIRADTDKLLRIDFNNFIITTANMSFQKTVFMKVDGFNIGLRDGYDVDFGFRALLCGIPIYFDRTVSSIHNDQINLRYYAKRQKAYMDSKRIIFSKYPELRTKIIADFDPKVPFYKSFFYGILKLKPAVNFFESKTFAAVFPKALRYRIYGSTIAALTFTE
ncbi:MAG: glycosyltransferase [Bacteroidota bacterium]|nr:glycosyltransferase [Bacteroidota bacterium]